jgi:uncharacterized protein (TIGR02466 family)|tara:strand:+ start:2502 stop:3164 length:663 start_codon:yes stop_codon:yes gene_type:complete
MIKLNKEDHFSSPVWYTEAPEFVKDLNKSADPHIKKSKENAKIKIKQRSKIIKNKTDMGIVYHSTPLTFDKNFYNFAKFIGTTCKDLLIQMGYDLTLHQVFMTEMWVQEFPKAGGGHHEIHTHWNGHISGFYFLKASDKTSMPIFHDPRPGHLMNGLPLKDEAKITCASPKVFYPAKPGRLMFFPSYLPHSYNVDFGVEPFRFIHFNCQAVSKGALNALQ